MVRKFTYGEPIRTGAVVKELSESDETLPYFEVSKDEDTVSFLLSLDEGDMIFGLGEAVRGINKRGFLYRSWNTDESHHTENANSLYASHNFLIFYGESKLFGVFFDDPGEVIFDLGFTDTSLALISSRHGDLDVYIVESDSLDGIVHEFRQLTGSSYIPPKWAFGFIQSRWGYMGEEDVMAVLDEHRQRKIPLDAICMDIDYMDHYKDFTLGENAIPDLQKMTTAMAEKHARLVPIIDAGVKIEDGYDVYDEGKEKDYFCKMPDGENFQGIVWPGFCCFPDFMRSDVRLWFGRQYQRLMKSGIEGFWNDMNEPALFASKNGVAAVQQQCAQAMSAGADVSGMMSMAGSLVNLKNSMADYSSFLQNADGRIVTHDRVHNLYGAKMTEGAAEGMREFDPDKRFLLFSRSSYIGSHRYAGVWQGDNSSWWSHLLMEMKMLTSLNMCGYLYNGADIGGFNCDTSPDLLMRWLELGIFTPLMRNHCAMGQRNQEIYQFSIRDDMTNMVTCRYALLPFIYSEFMKAALTDSMMFRPMSFAFPEDKIALRIEDQVMLGSSCMIAPVYEQNADGRTVYLPEDMLLVRFRSFDDYDLVPMKAGLSWVDAKLNEALLFIRKGEIVPIANGRAEYVDMIRSRDLTLLGWIDHDCTFSIYDDDGFTTSPDLEKGTTVFTVRCDEKGALAEKKEGYILNTEKIIVK